MKTKQEIFDQVVNHLLTQNATAMRSDGVCQYKDDQGRKCAAGCLVDEAHYTPDMEGLTVSSAVCDQHVNTTAKTIVEVFSKSGVNLNDPEIVTLLDSLQSIHDRGHPPDWYASLQLAAQKHNLQFNYVQKAA